MKTVIATAAIITTFVTPAYAQLEILPHLFADKFCMLRRVGVSRNEAISASIKEASVSGTSTQVNLNGKLIGVDIINATEAVNRLCPELMKP